MSEIFRIFPEETSRVGESFDEALWADEYEQDKLPKITSLATCNCPNCNKEVKLQAALISSGAIESQSTNQKIVFFINRAIMKRLASKKLNAY